jgi:hypothetical protein
MNQGYTDMVLMRAFFRYLLPLLIGVVAVVTLFRFLGVMALPVLLITFGLWWWVGTRRKRQDEAQRRAGTYADRFAYVERDGSVRHLTDSERSQLNNPTNGGPDHIVVKARYDSRDLQGDISGFVEISKVPADRLPTATA